MDVETEEVVKYYVEVLASRKHDDSEKDLVRLGLQRMVMNKDERFRSNSMTSNLEAINLFQKLLGEWYLKKWGKWAYGFTDVKGDPAVLVSHQLPSDRLGELTKDTSTLMVVYLEVLGYSLNTHLSAGEVFYEVRNPVDERRVEKMRSSNLEVKVDKNSILEVDAKCIFYVMPQAPGSSPKHNVIVGEAGLAGTRDVVRTRVLRQKS